MGVEKGNRKRVMFVLPNHRWASDERYTMWLIFPTQICLLAAQIEDKYDVEILDCIIDDLTIEEFSERVRHSKPDVVGVSNFTHEYSKAGHRAIEVVKAINPDIITVMGGVYVITSPELAIQNTNLDYGIIGEGELTIQQLLAHLFEGQLLPDKGFCFRKDGKLVIQPRSPFITNLDQLKYPAYHLVDFMKYAMRPQREAPSRPRALPYARVCMTRGCPIGCTFCTVESISGGPTRYRSAEHMVGELEMLKNKYGIKCILWDDDNLFMNKVKAKEVLRLMIERNLNLVWMLEATAIFCMDEELVELCGKSGCKYLNIALESGSERVLKEVIKKPVIKEKALRLIKKMKEVAIEINSNFVIGNPGETWDEIWETVRFAEDIDIDYVKFFICTPFPKTKMFDMAKEMGYLDDSIRFDEHHWTGGTFNTEHWRARDLAVVRAYEWDRINFSKADKRKKTCEMMGISEDRLNEIRRVTLEAANPDTEKNDASKLHINRYITTKDETPPFSSVTSSSSIHVSHP